jgi:long-chain acyl-CoA synthetase
MVHTGAAQGGRRQPDINGIAALPLYHIFALTLCLLAIRSGSHITLDPEPARHRPLRRSAEEAAVPHAACGEHAVQRAAAAPAVHGIDFSRLYVSQAGAWRLRKERRASGDRPRAA